METKVKIRLLLFITLTLITVFCGLGSRSSIIPLPGFVSEYSGDTLWAMAVFWGFCVIAPLANTWKIVITTLLFSFAIEFSQFYHAGWIDSVREIRLGGLVLGFGFKLTDLACYLTGVLIAAVIHFFITKKQSKIPIQST